MVNASNHLLEAQRLNPIAMAEAYVNQGTSPPSPVLKAAQDAYNLAEKRFQDITQIEAAIIAEQDRSITAAMAAKVEVGKAIAQVLAPTLPHLLQAMNQAWTTLRSLRAVGDAIAHATAGQLPVDWLARYQETQPLQADRVGYPVNQDLISQWQSALAALVQDADTELPE